ncbi:hypothetical protein FOCC_FOCC001738 [Frankliniella occidentalis]|nr:hypothetical protein FOCC_FOCC001738 [Frankliniella occidentalis]
MLHLAVGAHCLPAVRAARRHPGHWLPARAVLRAAHHRALRRRPALRSPGLVPVALPAGRRAARRLLSAHVRRALRPGRRQGRGVRERPDGEELLAAGARGRQAQRPPPRRGRDHQGRGPGHRSSGRQVVIEPRQLRVRSRFLLWCSYNKIYKLHLQSSFIITYFHRGVANDSGLRSVLLHPFPTLLSFTPICSI